MLQLVFQTSLVFCHTCGEFRLMGIRSDATSVTCSGCRGELIERVEDLAQRDALAHEYHVSGPLPVIPPPSSHVVLTTNISLQAAAGPTPSIAAPLLPPPVAAPQQGQGPLSLVDLFRREVDVANRQAAAAGTAPFSLPPISFHAPMMSTAMFVQQGGHGMMAGLSFDDILRQTMHRVLMEHEPNSRPTPPDVVARLRRSTTGPVAGDDAAATVTALPESDSSSMDPCAICQDTMRASAEAPPVSDDFLHVLQLPCGHWFHTKCIEPWLSMATTCPSCRRAVI